MISPTAVFDGLTGLAKSRTLFFKLEGKKVVQVPNVMAWASWYETADRTVAKAKIGRVRISTVFLGLNHRFGPGEPLVFETMVFGGAMNGEMSRSATWEQADNDHAEMVRLVTLAERKAKRRRNAHRYV